MTLLLKTKMSGFGQTTSTSVILDEEEGEEEGGFLPSSVNL
jgi:hypothetical protein